MAKRRLEGFQKPIDTGQRKAVGLAVVSYSDDGGLAQCSCGQPFRQPREKVREDAIDRHFIKKHQGRGIRL